MGELSLSPGVSRALVLRILAAHAEAVHGGPRALLKSSRRVRVSAVCVGDRVQGGGRFVVKEILDRGAVALAKNALFGSRGRRAWRAAPTLSHLGVATAAPVALEERRRLGLVAESAFVTRALDGLRPVSELFAERWQPGAARSPAATSEKRALLRALARTLRRLHDGGVYHADLSARNLFVSPADPGGPVYVIDLESVRAHLPLTRGRRAKPKTPWVISGSKWRATSRRSKKSSVRSRR